MADVRGHITELLSKARVGDEAAREALLRTMYTEVRGLARGHLARERRDHILQPTALVHEVYVRLLEARRIPGTNRAQLVSYLSTAMRHILVDHARARDRLKRGGGRERVGLTEDLVAGRDPNIDLLALDEALDRLAELDERKSRVVEMRYFGGLGVEDVAAALDISPATVKRDWEVARTWLFSELKKGDTRFD